MNDPPRWTADQLAADMKTAAEVFRRERLEEPVEAYGDAFDRFQGDVEELFEISVDLTKLSETALDILSRRESLDAFRYLAGPPISIDDLKTVAEAESLQGSRLRKDSVVVQRILGVIQVSLDRRRFAWISENREPTDAEKHAAIIASAALMATQRVSTERRNAGKKGLEGLTETAMSSVGLLKVARRKITNIAHAPNPGEFCEESYLGRRKADFVLRLWDERVMPIECKSSNSATNSVKRLNNDVAAKAEAWRVDFGALQVVPAAVLSGVFKLHNLEDAQSRGLTLFWGHNLAPMIEWIEKTRP